MSQVSDLIVLVSRSNVKGQETDTRLLKSITKYFWAKD